jgi:hypothetical protein
MQLVGLANTRISTDDAQKSLSSLIVGQDPSDSKPNRLCVDIFRFLFIYVFEVYSIDSSKMIGNCKPNFLV